MRSNKPYRVQFFLLLNLVLSCSVLKTEAVMTTPSVLVVSGCTPDMLQYDDSSTTERKEPRLTATEKRNDQMDSFNHPRRRKAMILQELGKKMTNGDADKVFFTFEKPSSPSPDLNIYAKHSITSERLIEFLTNAWKRWDALGESRDTLTSMAMAEEEEDADAPSAPPLIPGNAILHRDPHQRPSKNVMGQIGFFCTDTCTPVFDQLYEELLWDAAVMQHAAEQAKDHVAVYALGTHPGHHAAVDSFGGYCYVNHAALVAKLLQTSQQQQQDSNHPSTKVAILDVDYHCGNGSAAIFYEDPNVLVISIHCDPDFEYPFHSGFADEDGAGPGKGATLHLPLAPGTGWKDGYHAAMETAMSKVRDFGATALVVSMGLDTLDKDPCALRRAGLRLSGKDYYEMGQTIGHDFDYPVVFVQEGGYFLKLVPDATREVLTGFAAAKASSKKARKV